MNHDAPGEIQIGSNWNYRWVAKNPPAGMNVPAITDHDFSKVRFIGFIGCDTGNSGPNYGNLLVEAHEKGAQCAMGFTGTIYFNQNPPEGHPRTPFMWTNHFWSALMDWLDGTDWLNPPDGVLDPPMTIYEAAHYAARRLDLYWQTGEHGYGAFTWEGTVDMKLSPASP